MVCIHPKGADVGARLAICQGAHGIGLAHGEQRLVVGLLIVDDPIQRHQAVRRDHRRRGDWPWDHARKLQAGIAGLLGYNCRLDTLQACVLQTKMQYIEPWTEQRREIAAWYREELDGSDITLPYEREEVRHVYHLYVVRHARRDQLMKHLAEQGIHCGIHYPNPLPTASPFLDSVTIPLGLPVVSKAAKEILSLPMYPELTREQVARIARSILSFELQEAVA